MVVVLSCLVAKCVWLFVTPWTAEPQASFSSTISWCLPKYVSIASVMPSNHLILCQPLFLPPSIFPNTRVFSFDSAVHFRWPKYCSSNFNIRPSNEYSGLIAFRIDWFDLFAIQGILSTTVQKHQFFASLPSLWSSSHWGLGVRVRVRG